MSGKHAPSAEQLQEAYEYWASGCGGSDGGEVEHFLSTHDAVVAERAWREGYYTGKRDYAGSIMGGMSISTPNPYAEKLMRGKDA